MSIRREDPRARPARFLIFHASSVSLSADIDVEGVPTLRYSAPDSCNLFTQTVNFGPIRVTAGSQVIVTKPQVDDVFCRIPTLRDLEAHYGKSKLAKLQSTTIATTPEESDREGY